MVENARRLMARYRVVATTDPAPGEPVSNGDTVVLYVSTDGDDDDDSGDGDDDD